MTGVWDQIGGQERVRELLAPSASDPAGAYLFIGPPGVGKVTTARVFSAAILCPDQCGACSVCTRVLRGTHPDVSWFQPEGNTHRVAAIRELVASAALTPLEGTRRVIIIEEADRILERSQNALLKALEEPGQSVTWILVAEALDPFLPTVLSRCQIVEFAMIPESTVAVLIKDQLDVDATEATRLVRAARGDLGRTIALATDENERSLRATAFAAATRAEAEPRWVLSVAEKIQLAAQTARSSVEKQQKAELESLDDVHGKGAWRKRVLDRQKRALRAAETGVYSDFMIWLGVAFRDLAAVSAGADIDTTTAPDHGAGLAAAAPAKPTAFWLDMAEAAVEGDLAVKENAFGPLVVEGVLLRLVL